jgi:hypothetical protein
MRWLYCRSTPLSRANATSLSRTSRAELLRGNHLLVSSSIASSSPTSSSIHCRHSSTLQVENILYFYNFL